MFDLIKSFRKNRINVEDTRIYIKGPYGSTTMGMYGVTYPTDKVGTDILKFSTDFVVETKRILVPRFFIATIEIHDAKTDKLLYKRDKVIKPKIKNKKDNKLYYEGDIVISVPSKEIGWGPKYWYITILGKQSNKIYAWFNTPKSA